MAVYLGQNEVILRNDIGTTDVDATAADILARKTAYVNDKKLLGVMPMQQRIFTVKQQVS